MNNERWKNFAQNMFRIGTPECAVSFGVIAMVLALLFLLLGFWQTLLIAALVALGAFIAQSIRASSLSGSTARS